MTASPLLQVCGLRVGLDTGQGLRSLIRDIHFELHKGEILGILGPSGAGKSVLARALAGLLRPPETGISGQVLFKGQGLSVMRPSDWNSVRGRGIFMLFQSGAQALNPCMTVGQQFLEIMPPKSNGDDGIRFLDVVGLPAHTMVQYPHEISGGMAIRVQVALALALNPRVLIADEPTTGLDPDNRALVCSVLENQARRWGTGIVLISHDLSVLSQWCRRLLIMDEGRMVEAGLTRQIIDSPKSDVGRELVAALRYLEACQ